MPGRICRERRREVRPGEIAGRGAERCEGRIAASRGIAIASAGRTGSLVGLADASDRAPELVVVLRLPDGDTGVGHGHVHQRQEPRELDDIRAHLVGDLRCDLVVEPRRRAQAWRPIIGPVSADLGLFRGALRRCDDTVAAQAIDLVESGRILRTVQSRWRWNPELVGRLHHKWFYLAPVCAQSERDLTDRVLAPFARLVTRDEINADARLGGLRAIVGPERENGGGRPVPKLKPIRLCTSIRDLAEVFGKLLVETLRL